MVLMPNATTIWEKVFFFLLPLLLPLLSGDAGCVRIRRCVHASLTTWLVLSFFFLYYVPSFVSQSPLVPCCAIISHSFKFRSFVYALLVCPTFWFRTRSFERSQSSYILIAVSLDISSEGWVRKESYQVSPCVLRL
uniref:Uncharacterized protein n=1 Tax=Trypanosoma vivax (strain Y486) TaxID=1055687 RepID=G0U1R3_TRYVY|nr:hypothetical protein TVY486_0900350 [Trypanosoma vivax Y486]